MKHIFVVLALLCAALTVQAATTSTPTVQNVRFTQESTPVNVVVPPLVLIHPAAIYTDEARKGRIEGDVIVQAYFDEEGKATPLKVVKGLGYGLDEKALEALYWWRFSPALRNGLPVSAVAEIEVPFLFAKHVEVTADAQVLANGVLHFKGNVELRITEPDGSVSTVKGNDVVYRSDQIDARVTIRKVQ
jgi:TonB family protein